MLVEERQRGKWRGRTPQNKLVFFTDERDWRGQLVDVRVTWSGPWSMQARLSDELAMIETELALPLLSA